MQFIRSIDQLIHIYIFVGYQTRGVLTKRPTRALKYLWDSMQETATTKHDGCGCHKSLPTFMLPTKQFDNNFLHRFYRAKSL
jgi:hypothetical protein